MVSLSYSIIFDLYSSDGWMISFTLTPRNMKRYADLYSTPQETLFGPSPVDVRAVFDRDRPFAARLRITRYFYSRFKITSISLSKPSQPSTRRSVSRVTSASVKP
jgi:hypothetical protein